MEGGRFQRTFGTGLNQSLNCVTFGKKTARMIAMTTDAAPMLCSKIIGHYVTVLRCTLNLCFKQIY